MVAMVILFNINFFLIMSYIFCTCKNPLKCCLFERIYIQLISSGTSDECGEKTLKDLSNQEIGHAKLSGFCKWFSHHSVIRESEDASSSHMELDCQKMVIFAHHLKVLDGIQVSFVASQFSSCFFFFQNNQCLQQTNMLGPVS